jgi:hypothetical protein
VLASVEALLDGRDAADPRELRVVEP